MIAAALLEVWLRTKLDVALAWIEKRANAMSAWGRSRNAGR